MLFFSSFLFVVAQAEDVNFYVTNRAQGTDLSKNADGSIQKPFATIFDARDAVRLSLLSKENGARHVYLEGGTHYLDSTFKLDAEMDSGTLNSPVVYTSTPGEQATISGGVQILASAFKDAIINDNVSVKMINLFDHGINSSIIGEYANPYPKAKLELFYGGRAMIPAREPNIGSAEDPTLWNWVGYENMTGFIDKSGVKNFGFKDVDIVQKWAALRETGSLWLHGYFKFDWRDTFVNVESILPSSDNSSFIVTVSNSTPPQEPFTAGSRFYAVNHLGLLDAPQEYHVNATTG